jgi:hypothetical protein
VVSSLLPNTSCGLVDPLATLGAMRVLIRENTLNCFLKLLPDDSLNALFSPIALHGTVSNLAKPQSGSKSKDWRNMFLDPTVRLCLGSYSGPRGVGCFL